MLKERCRTPTVKDERIKRVEVDGKREEDSGDDREKARMTGARGVGGVRMRGYEQSHIGEAVRSGELYSFVREGKAKRLHDSNTERDRL